MLTQSDIYENLHRLKTKAASDTVLKDFDSLSVVNIDLKKNTLQMQAFTFKIIFAKLIRFSKFKCCSLYMQVTYGREEAKG